MRPIHMLPILLPCALAGCVTTYEAGAPEGAVDVIAHRGASAYAPENTLASFAEAIRLGADWFELDCTLTKDGAVVVIHDDTVDRTTAGTGAVKDLTLLELKELEAGAWFDLAHAGQPIPTLGEALDLAKGRIGVYVEIKGAGGDGPTVQALLDPTLDDAAVMARIAAADSPNLALTRACIQEIRERKMGRQVVIQSFSPTVCFVAMQEAPELRTELLGGYNPDKPAAWEQFTALARRMNVAGCNVAHTHLSEEQLSAFHDEGRTVAVWTVNEAGDMERYAAMGVDAIITDRPDRCLETLRSVGAR